MKAAGGKVLVIDLGGNHVKLLATGQRTPVKAPSGPGLTPKGMVKLVRKATRGWKFDRVSLGYPGMVWRGRPVAEPHNLGRGWVKFDFEKAFGRAVRIVNDAAMQALGSYKGGKMLFLGLGTGLGSALIDHGVLLPLELAHLPYRKATFEHYVGASALKRMGKKKWRRNVKRVVRELQRALEPDYVVLGGGNVKKLKKLPTGTRRGDNANAFHGGFRLWRKENALGRMSLSGLAKKQGASKSVRRAGGRKNAGESGETRVSSEP